MTEKETVKCPFHKVDMPVSNCLTRQKIVAEKPQGDSPEAMAYKLYKIKCGECEIGLKLYREANGITEDKSIEAKPAQAPTPGPETPKESKLCPCGEEFFRQPGQNDISWLRSKYCPKHANMTPHYRKKAFEKMELPKPESKVCDICGNIFYREESTPIVVWEKQRYCSKKCSRVAIRTRDIMRKRNSRKRIAEARVFDLEKAETIAREETENNLKLISAFVENTQQLDQLRALAIRVGIDSQKSAHEAAWAS
jgi:hypothetical protein